MCEPAFADVVMEVEPMSREGHHDANNGVGGAVGGRDGESNCRDPCWDGWLVSPSPMIFRDND